MSNTIGRILTKRAQLNAARDALVEVERGRRYTYSQLNETANRVANALSARGVRQGDRVAFLQMNGVEFVASYFAVAKLGAVLVPLNWRLAADELEFIISDSGALTLIYDAEFEPVVATLKTRKTPIRQWLTVGQPDGVPEPGGSFDALVAAAPSTEPPSVAHDDDLLFIMYTSGTTGRPKGAMHTHDSMLWGSLTMNLTCDLRDRDRDLVVLPLFHIGALLPLTAVMHRGGTSVIMRAYDTRHALEAIDRERVTTSLLVTTILRMLIEHPDRASFDLSSLRWAIVGGEPVPITLLERCAELGITILQDYGMTECGPATVTSADEAAVKPGSAGKAYVHTDIRVVDSAGKDVNPGQVGEILVRGRHVMQGYWNRPDATADAIRDGWFYTGDLAAIDDDGSVYIRERKKDMIISGGENIYPAEIEMVLANHPAVKEVAVIGVPSARWGESLLAVVVAKDSARPEADDLIAFCRNHIAGFKIPRAIEFVDALPRTPTGKVQKQRLREQFGTAVRA